MWRAMFLALGFSLVILGAECLVIDKAVLATPAYAAMAGQAGATRIVSPAEWAPWTFLSAGAIILLYSFTIPRRVHG